MPTEKELEMIESQLSENGTLLQFLDTTCRANKRLVLAACTQNGDALQWADDALKADRDVVMRALSKTSPLMSTTYCPYEFASESLRSDKEIFLAANAQDPKSILFISKHLQVDEEILQAINSHDVQCLTSLLYIGIAIAKDLTPIRILLSETTIQITSEISRKLWTGMQWFEPGPYDRGHSAQGRDDIIEYLLNDYRIHFDITESDYLKPFWYIPRVKKWFLTRHADFLERIGLPSERASFLSCDPWVTQLKRFDKLLDEIEMVSWIPTSPEPLTVQWNPLYRSLNMLTKKGGFRFREIAQEIFE